MVPNGWKKGVIEDIAKVSSGGTPSRQNDAYWLGGQIPWVTTTEVKFGVIKDTEQKITEAGLKNSSAKLFPKDTILMAMYGQGKTRGQVAKLGIEASTNQACAALLLNDGFEVDYYYQYLVSQYENIRELANSGGQQNLSAGIIKSIHIPIPPQLEQRKIAKVLSTWDKAISTTERLIDNSKQQKKALMQQLLTGAQTQRKRLLDDSGKPFEGEWEEVKLGELGTTFTSLTGKTKSDFGSGKLYVPYINIFKNASVDINHLERVNISENERQNEVKFGDIFFTTSSETPEEVGMSSVMLDMPNEAVYLNSFCFGFRLHSFEQATPIFMKHVLRSSSVRRFISILAQGATRYNLSKTQLLKVKISLPKKEEQQKIASVLNNADKEIELLEQQLADLKKEKKALMQQLLTGKKRVLI